VRRWTAAAAIGLITGLLALVTAAPAVAAVRGRIVSVEAKNGTLHVVFSAAGLGPTETIDPASVTLTLDGQPLTAKVEQGGAAQAAIVRRVVLAIDTSGSMLGPRILAAKQAAQAYLSKVPADVSVGLVTFSSTPALRVTPTTNRASLSAAVASLVAKDNTALYDAIQLALRQLGPTGDRSILVLSDGKDEGSRATLAADVASLRRAKVPVNAVVLGGDPAAQQALRTLSDAAGGRVVPARAAADLTAQFEQAARESDKDVALTAAIPARFSGGEAPVTVTATAGGAQVSDTAIAVNLVSSAVAANDPALFGPKAVKPITGFLRHKLVLYLGLAALFVGVGALLGFAFNGVVARPETMRGRLRPFVDNTGGRPVDTHTSRSVRDTAMGIADDIVKQRGLEESLAQKLDAGGIPLKPAEWLMVHIGIALLLPLMVLLLTNVNIVLTVTAVLMGILGPLGYLTVKAGIRTRQFLAQLPDTLQLLSGSLSAGYSLPQAVDAVVRQGTPPIADELRKALVETRLGAPIEEALDDVADRMDSKDFRWVVMAIRVQRQVGGNLAEVLSNTAATLRERERLRRQVQVLAAEGKLSAYILFGLPIVFALYLELVRPEYIKPLLTDPIGWVMLSGMAILLTVGGFWLRKVVKVEV
jgi:tight adherence protein B